MIRSYLITTLMISLLFVQNSFAEDEVIQFPDEELETETALPVFPVNEVVKNRNIELTKKTEVGVGFGSQLNEPLYNPMLFGFQAVYHLNEVQGLNFTYNQLSTDLSNNAKKLQAGEGGDIFDASLAPAPTSFMALNYEYSAFYGKISLSKQTVYNTSVFGTAGLGLLAYPGVSEPVLNLGLGEKVYLSKKWALRFDLNLQIYKAIDPTTADLQSGPVRTIGDFDKRLFINQTLMGGIIFIL